MCPLLLDRVGCSAPMISVTDREICERALVSGQIDVVREYAATFADLLNTGATGTDAAPVGTPGLTTTMKAARRLAEPRGLTVLEPGRAVDQNAFPVAVPHAAKHRLQTLSDLGRSGLPVRLAAGDECVQRPHGAPGLKETYDIGVTAVDPRGVGTTGVTGGPARPAEYRRFRGAQPPCPALPDSLP
nr:hypothetical protein C5F59_01050 [Streptomyces sp. QL37]